eukprot:4983064-Pyramimonas_sp.AAC.1
MAACGGDGDGVHAYLAHHGWLILVRLRCCATSRQLLMTTHDQSTVRKEYIPEGGTNRLRGTSIYLERGADRLRVKSITGKKQTSDGASVYDNRMCVAVANYVQ